MGRGGVLCARERRAVHSALCGGGADVALHVAGEEPFEQLTVAARRQQPGLENDIRFAKYSSIKNMSLKGLSHEMDFGF